jgi:hypothetical protein
VDARLSFGTKAALRDFTAEGDPVLEPALEFLRKGGKRPGQRKK